MLDNNTKTIIDGLQKPIWTKMDVDKSQTNQNNARLRLANEKLEHDAEYQSDFLSACFIAQVKMIMKHKRISEKKLAEKIDTGDNYVNEILNEDFPIGTLYSICELACALDSEVTITLTPRKK